MGTTRIKAIGKLSDEYYFLTVQDNGCGLQTPVSMLMAGQRPTLVQRLEGQFRRESLPSQGTLCELSWWLKKNLTLRPGVWFVLSKRLGER